MCLQSLDLLCKVNHILKASGTLVDLGLVNHFSLESSFLLWKSNSKRCYDGPHGTTLHVIMFFDVVNNITCTGVLMY